MNEQDYWDDMEWNDIDDSDEDYSYPIANPMAEFHFEFVSVERASLLESLLQRWLDSRVVADDPSVGIMYEVLSGDSDLVSDTIKALRDSSKESKTKRWAVVWKNVAKYWRKRAKQEQKNSVRSASAIRTLIKENEELNKRVSELSDKKSTTYIVYRII